MSLNEIIGALFTQLDKVLDDEGKEDSIVNE